MSLSGINFSGLGSGIDTQSIIARLIELERVPITRLQNQQRSLQGRQSVFQSLKSGLQSLASAASALNSASAFNPVSATSSKTEVATISASEGASVGTFQLAVSRLAQAHKIASAAQPNTTEAMNLSGSMTVNGRGVSITSTDTLTTIAQKINTADAGVTASVINGGTGQAYLTITSKSTGIAGKVQIADLSGTVASTLGLTSGAASIRSAITNGAQSSTFSSSTTAVGTMLGATGLGPTTIQLNGIDVNVDLSTQSLQDIAGAINGSGSGVTATVKTVSENGVNRYRLELTGAGSTPTFGDPDGTLEALGVLQKGFGNQMVAAQDAAYEIDGMDLTSSSNTITGVIPGVTITLLKANETTPETSTLTLSQDNTAVKNKVKEFMNAFNAVVDFVKQNSQFDKETFQSGPLFGDSTAQSVESMIGSSLFATVTGLTTSYTNLTQIGFTFDSSGKLKLDEGQLDSALAANPTAVGNLFRATGRGSTDQLQFVISSNKTKPSTAGPYSVVISQAATKKTMAFDLSGGTTSATQKLKFNGNLFANTEYTLFVAPGATVDQIVSQINNDSKLKDLLVATNDNGQLKFESKRYGTNGNFTLNVENGENEPTTSVLVEASEVDGLDVAGTINGEAATGAGQFLTGNSGNANTDGLQIQYTGSTTGTVGTMTVSMGIGASINTLISQFTDTVNGMLTTNDQALQAQIDDISSSIEALNARIVRKQQDLNRRFTAMEQAISAAQQQSSRLQSMLAQMG
jgi:flagellar hook-associated protein 2